MSQSKKNIWITWEAQRRNRSLSAALDLPLYELAEIDAIQNPVRKYALGLFRTLRIFWKEGPSVIFSQNPSIVLSCFSVLYGKCFKKKTVVDAHNAGLFPKEGNSKILTNVSRFIQKYADLTLITNMELKRHVEKNGGRGYVLQDPIPQLPDTPLLRLDGMFKFLFICSYAEDEPFDIVFDAARKVSTDIRVYVTGNYRKASIDISALPENITLLGFVSEFHYNALLRAVDATIDLTERDNCLVCGAYESIAAGKPMILSDKAALKAYFSMGALYTANTASDLAVNMRCMVNRKGELEIEVKKLKGVLSRSWEDSKNSLEAIVAGWI